MSFRDKLLWNSFTKDVTVIFNKKKILYLIYGGNKCVSSTGNKTWNKKSTLVTTWLRDAGYKLFSGTVVLKILGIKIKNGWKLIRNLKERHLGNIVFQSQLPCTMV